MHVVNANFISNGIEGHEKSRQEGRLIVFILERKERLHTFPPFQGSKADDIGTNDLRRIPITLPIVNRSLRKRTAQSVTKRGAERASG